MTARVFVRGFGGVKSLDWIPGVKRETLADRVELILVRRARVYVELGGTVGTVRLDVRERSKVPKG